MDRPGCECQPKRHNGAEQARGAATAPIAVSYGLEMAPADGRGLGPGWAELADLGCCFGPLARTLPGRVVIRVCGERAYFAGGRRDPARGPDHAHCIQRRLAPQRPQDWQAKRDSREIDSVGDRAVVRG